MSFKERLYDQDVLSRIGELRATDIPYTVISAKLKKEFDIDVTPITVSKA